MKTKKKKFSLTCVKEMKIAFYIMLWYFSYQPKRAGIHDRNISSKRDF